MRYLLLSLTLLASVSSGAFAQEWMVPPAPSVAVKKVSVGRATVALPPGNWQELGTFDVSAAGTGYVGQSETKLFVDYDKGLISGAIFITSNKGAENTFRAPDRCTRTDTIASDIQSLDKFKYSCLHINHFITTDPATYKGAPLSLLDAARSHGGIPNIWLAAVLDFAGQTQYDYLSVTVYRDPRRDGFNDPKTAWDQSAWHRSNISPDRMAIAQNMLAWSRTYRTTLLHDFRGE